MYHHMGIKRKRRFTKIRTNWEILGKLSNNYIIKEVGTSESQEMKVYRNYILDGLHFF